MEETSLVLKEIYRRLNAIRDLETSYEHEQQSKMLCIEDIVFNQNATIMFWNDGTKTVVKIQGEDNFDKEKAIALCVMKKVYGNGNKFNNVLNRFSSEDYCKDAYLQNAIEKIKIKLAKYDEAQTEEEKENALHGVCQSKYINKCSLFEQKSFNTKMSDILQKYNLVTYIDNARTLRVKQK